MRATFLQAEKSLPFIKINTPEVSTNVKDTKKWLLHLGTIFCIQMIWRDAQFARGGKGPFAQATERHTGTRMSVSFWNETTINSFRNDSFRINVTLVSCGNRYELVLEQNSFRYHVESP